MTVTVDLVQTALGVHFWSFMFKYLLLVKTDFDFVLYSMIYFYFFQNINLRCWSLIMDFITRQISLYKYSGSDSSANVPGHVITNCQFILLKSTSVAL